MNLLPTLTFAGRWKNWIAGQWPISRLMDKYEYVFAGGNANAYLFRTQYGVVYEVKFKQTPYLFTDQPDVADDVFELVIEVVQEVSGRVPPDSYIPNTIAAICTDFFRQKDRIIVYICDTSDRRQSARVRKFNAWFTEFADHQYVKFDTQFPDVGGVTHHVSLILRWNHPFLHTAVSAFGKLSELYGGEK
jgi:Family of unknown function (DUF6169)